ncbi:hypothetical protein [Nitrosovibrio sp. Nv4]|uniref:hypothetical protein n=1 Tax=Nitrosovibrio sp. Nv4 TaxID=1945880 RepID=UPI0015E73755|nr:hypothetical protein [Nitrosovibrio sp. Nv4]
MQKNTASRRIGRTFNPPCWCDGFHQTRKLSAFTGKSAAVARHLARHFATTLGALAACRGTVVHAVQLFAAFGTRIANLGANSADLIAVRRTAQHEVKRRLTDFGTVHHQAEMIGFDMPAAQFQAVIHGGLQASLMAIVACCNAGLHALVVSHIHEHGSLLFKDHQRFPGFAMAKPGYP